MAASKAKSPVTKRAASKAKAAPTALERLDAMGIEKVCERIESGESQAEIARNLKVNAAILSAWLNRDDHAKRSARAREFSAEAWLDRGLEAVGRALQKKSGIDSTAARAYAQECARRAALRNPRYVERTALEFTGAGGGPVLMTWDTFYGRTPAKPE